MDRFEFQNPTRIIFGRDQVERAGETARELGSRLLMVIGSGSVRRNGVLQRVTDLMEQAGLKIIFLEGVVPNPRLSKVREGIDLSRKFDVDLICGLGGGSVMDTAKAIAAGTKIQDDVWDIFLGKKEIDSALPVMTIPTLAASGSEMNGFMVITNEDSGLKLAAGSIHTFPKVSILDPVLTFTVPPNQTAYGGVDAVCHLMEPYFNGTYPDTPIQDSIAEALMRNIINATTGALKDPGNYDYRATMMWGATLALNGLTKAGVGEHRFPVHMIEHAVSAIFDIPHAAGLAALLPGWMRWKTARNEGEKIAHMGRNVLNTETKGSSETGAKAAISTLASWLREIGCPASLGGLKITQEDHEKIADIALVQANIWGINNIYNKETILEILSFCQ